MVEIVDSENIYTAHVDMTGGKVTSITRKRPLRLCPRGYRVQDSLLYLTLRIWIPQVINNRDGRFAQER